jgi:hypothetical protein
MILFQHGSVQSDLSKIEYGGLLAEGPFAHATRKNADIRARSIVIIDFFIATLFQENTTRI